MLKNDRSLTHNEARCALDGAHLAFISNTPLPLNIGSDLLTNCAKGDRKAQFELYQECYAVMMRVCLRYHKNDEDAKHVLNTAFLKVCMNLNQYNTNIPFEHWLRRITINACIDDYRKNKTRKETVESQDLSESTWNNRMSDLNLGEQELNAEALRELIRSLPPISQQVFNLAVLDGYPYDEVAEKLSISEATCRWHVHFSRKTLQKLLKETFKSLKTLAL